MPDPFLVTPPRLREPRRERSAQSHAPPPPCHLGHGALRARPGLCRNSPSLRPGGPPLVHHSVRAAHAATVACRDLRSQAVHTSSTATRAACAQPARGVTPRRAHSCAWRVVDR
ncbi:hypothetical protein STRIP9103_05569 [Streptomyces ipomoeae 91-03]|uniref:Uncharacterized protein n=1 Tax=Streptomyces ipomoeae 91-03 TaxID=698759 RepID=L1L4H3_9ACTN|nr:hypothetical protein STRIP9103_05569 [Streptomyces ipomoeae 91-03]